MNDVPLYASRLWPPVRPRTGDASASTLDLLHALGLIARTDATGVHSLLPLGLRVHDRLTAIARHAFEERGALTFAPPTLQSRTLWEQTGRWDVYRREGALLTVSSSSGEEMCLAPTSEEIAAATVREHLRSHRDLPVRLSLSTTKFRDELSPRGGLMRGREFTMADAYTFDTGPDTMRDSVDFLNEACTAALTGMGLTGTFTVPADGGSISAGPSTEHLVLADNGQGTIVACTHCGNRGDGAVLAAGPPPPGPRRPARTRSSTSSPSLSPCPTAPPRPRPPPSAPTSTSAPARSPPPPAPPASTSSTPISFPPSSARRPAPSPPGTPPAPPMSCPSTTCRPPNWRPSPSPTEMLDCAPGSAGAASAACPRCTPAASTCTTRPNAVAAAPVARATTASCAPSRSPTSSSWARSTPPR
ncbi:aminoacyl--tRNA ligase-related protein [Streptomyces goshikiensis]|uniref:aminoacyl--tRNA ligase-related protein n=1 Tax=Streptomyces goshikiensis TaxID=1942 RepID=UPI0036ACAC88